MKNKFDSSKAINTLWYLLYDNKFTYQSFNNVINDIGISENMKALNIYQLSKIGLMALTRNFGGFPNSLDIILWHYNCLLYWNNR